MTVVLSILQDVGRKALFEYSLEVHEESAWDFFSKQYDSV